MLARLARLALLLAGALVVVLGGLRLHGAYRLRSSELALAAVLGDGGGSRDAPVGGDGTAAPWIRAALDRLDVKEEDLKALAELAMLGPAALSTEQRVEATRLVTEQAAVLDALRGTVGWPAARLGYWQNPEPEQEGEIQARLLTLAQLASVEGRLGCEQADPVRFERAMGILLRLAAGLEMEDQTQPVLVGLMVENIQHLLLARGIASAVADPGVRGGVEAPLSPVDLRLAYFRTLRSQEARLRALRSPRRALGARLPEPGWVSWCTSTSTWRGPWTTSGSRPARSTGPCWLPSRPPPACRRSRRSPWRARSARPGGSRSSRPAGPSRVPPSP